MLVLSRKVTESIVILTEKNRPVIVQVIEASRGRVRLGIVADDSVLILREEILKGERAPGCVGTVR